MKSKRLQIGKTTVEVRIPEGGQERRRGLLGIDRAPDWGLLLSAAPLIHSFGMKFKIDLVWIRGGQVVCVASKVPPGRMRGAWAWRCLELPSGEAERLGIKRGDRVRTVR